MNRICRTIVLALIINSSVFAQSRLQTLASAMPVNCGAGSATTSCFTALNNYPNAGNGGYSYNSGTSVITISSLDNILGENYKSMYDVERDRVCHFGAGHYDGVNPANNRFICYDVATNLWNVVTLNPGFAPSPTSNANHHTYGLTAFVERYRKFVTNPTNSNSFVEMNIDQDDPMTISPSAYQTFVTGLSGGGNPTLPSSSNFGSIEWYPDANQLIWWGYGQLFVDTYKNGSTWQHLHSGTPLSPGGNGPCWDDAGMAGGFYGVLLYDQIDHKMIFGGGSQGSTEIFAYHYYTYNSDGSCTALDDAPSVISSPIFHTHSGFDHQINLYTFAGTSNGSGNDQIAVPQDSTSGSGACTGTKWTVIENVDTTYSVSIADAGYNCHTGDTVKILGNHLSGTSPANDLTMTITDTTTGQLVVTTNNLATGFTDPVTGHAIIIVPNDVGGQPAGPNATATFVYELNTNASTGSQWTERTDLEAALPSTTNATFWPLSGGFFSTGGPIASVTTTPLTKWGVTMIITPYSTFLLKTSDNTYAANGVPITTEATWGGRVGYIPLHDYTNIKYSWDSGDTAVAAALAAKGVPDTTNYPIGPDFTTAEPGNTRILCQPIAGCTSGVSYVGAQIPVITSINDGIHPATNMLTFNRPSLTSESDAFYQERYDLQRSSTAGTLPFYNPDNNLGGVIWFKFKLYQNTNHLQSYLGDTPGDGNGHGSQGIGNLWDDHTEVGLNGAGTRIHVSPTGSLHETFSTANWVFPPSAGAWYPFQFNVGGLGISPPTAVGREIAINNNTYWQNTPWTPGIYTVAAVVQDFALTATASGTSSGSSLTQLAIPQDSSVSGNCKGTIWTVTSNSDTSYTGTMYDGGYGCTVGTSVKILGTTLSGATKTWTVTGAATGSGSQTNVIPISHTGSCTLTTWNVTESGGSYVVTHGSYAGSGCVNGDQLTLSGSDIGGGANAVITLTSVWTTTSSTNDLTLTVATTTGGFTVDLDRTPLASPSTTDGIEAFFELQGSLPWSGTKQLIEVDYGPLTEDNIIYSNSKTAASSPNFSGNPQIYGIQGGSNVAPDNNTVPFQANKIQDVVMRLDETQCTSFSTACRIEAWIDGVKSQDWSGWQAVWDSTDGLLTYQFVGQITRKDATQVTSQPDNWAISDIMTSTEPVLFNAVAGSSTTSTSDRIRLRKGEEDFDF